MNRRVLLGGLLLVVCLATLWGLLGQRSQLAGLRTEQQQLLAEMASRADGSASLATADAGAGPRTPPPTLVATPELLRLRSEVTRLTECRRELAGGRAENERLRAQLASRVTNSPAVSQLPPGYMRRSEARMVGYNTPDDTLQSLLWAVQNHDLTNFLQGVTPTVAEEIRSKVAVSNQTVEDFFGQAAAFFLGMHVLRREQDASDGSMAVEVEVIPGEAGRWITFRQINGQWKMASHF